MSVKIPNKNQKPQIKGQVLPNISKQGPLPQRTNPSPIARQQIAPPNVTGKNVNFTKRNPSNQMTDAVKTMATNMTALRKENAELKAKLQQKSQP